MTEKRKFQAIKGTRDLLPPETELWNRVEQTARQVFGTYGFGEIRPPMFEPTELFARSIGLDTDVVSKEMYSFEDRDDTSVSLRPEATASVCRAFIEHGMHALPQPVKLHYTGPMFRRERPQRDAIVSSIRLALKSSKRYSRARPIQRRAPEKMLLLMPK